MRRSCTCENYSWYGEGHASECAVTLLEDADAEIKRLKEANRAMAKSLSWITRCCRMSGPCDISLYAIGDKHMAEAKEALTKASQ